MTTATEARFRPGVDEARDHWYLHERYRSVGGTGRHLRAGFYAIKPLLPRRLQIAVRSAAASRQRQRTFPAWPYEDVLLRVAAEALAAELARSGQDRLPVVNLWPGSARFAYVISHDVEGPAGFELIPRMLEIERRHGIVSTWNVCGDWYPVADDDLRRIRDAGCEVGLHGLHHDGRLFHDRASFERYLPAIAERMQEWGAVGFRAPATHRNAEWMHELPCLYDSSFPHSDPFQPLAGGCCAIHPFQFGDVVELPITLDQDFTLFELLGERTIRLWTEKAKWIVRHHGLVSVIVHPDYMDDERLELYEELLAFLAALPGGWHALSRDAAQWWRERRALEVDADAPDRPRVVGAAAERAAVAWAVVQDGAVGYRV